MNKKFFLGAILLGTMTLSTGALTSCIDNDEPEGITNLRGAKAELLRAKAAVELAKAEAVKQTANWIAAKAAVEQAIAKIKEAKAKQEEAKIAYEQAQSDKAKAEAMERMALAEAEVARIKAQNELDLQKLKNELLEAQNNYDKLLAEIEAAKAVLTDAQATKLEALQTAVDAAWSVYKVAESTVLTKMNAVFLATTGEEDSIERLEKKLADNQAKLEAINAAYAELKTLADEATPTAWEARRDSLDNYANKAANLEKAELQLQKDEIMQSAEYKAADKEDKAALGAYIAAQQEYNYLANGNSMDCFSEAGNPAPFGYQQNGTHPVSSARSAKKYDLQGASIAINNPTVFTKIQAAIDPAYSTTVVDNWAGKHFEAPGNVVSQNSGLTYDQFNNAFNPWAPSGNPYQAKVVAAWEEALNNVKVTDEEIAADNCVADFEKAVADAQKAHNEAVAKWEKAHKTYSDQAVETSVSTDDFKAAIKKYNDNIDALETAVTTYNETYDATLTSLYNQILEKTKIVFATTEINAVLAASPAVGGTVGSRTSLALIDALIESSTLTAAQKTAKKTDYKTAMNNKWATKTLAQITTAENDAMAAAKIAVVSEDAVVKAGEKISKSDGSGVLDKIKKADGGWNTTDKVYTGSYATIAKAVADFIVAADKNSEKQTSAAAAASTTVKQESYTGVAAKAAKTYINGGNKTTPTYADVTNTMWVETKYELDDDDNYVNKGHKVVVRTKVSDAAINAMTAVEFNPAVAEANWNTASNEAFGTPYRHTELTVDLINKNTTPYEDEAGNQLNNWAASTLKALDDAKQTLANHQNLQGVNAEIASLKEKVAAAKAAIQEQIAGYTKAVNEAKAAIEPAKKEHQAKHHVASKLTAEVDAAIRAINAKIGEYNTLVADLNNILAAYYNNVEFSYIDENGNTVTMTPGNDFSAVKTWLKRELAKYEKSNPGVRNSEGKIKDAEAAVALAEKELERATANDEFDAVASAKLELEQAKAELEVAKSRYDFALSQLNDYIAALAK